MCPRVMQGKLLWLMSSLLVFSTISKPSLANSGDICGTTSFSNPSGTIGFPDVGEISENSACDYRIVVGDNNFVSLRFQKFDVSTYLAFCDTSWMTISCFSSEISGIVTSKSPKLCGETKWSSTLKLYYCPVLSLELLYNRLDIFSSAFTLEYEIAPLSVASNSSDTGELSDNIDCGQTVFTNRSGVIALPYSRNITRTRVNCTYTISRGEPDSVMSSLTLNVTFLDLLTLADELDGCAQDRLQIICTDDNGRHLSSTNCETFSSDFLANPTYFRCLKLEITIHSDTFDPRDTRQIAYDMIADDEDDYDDDYDYQMPTSDHNHGRNSTCGGSVYTGQGGFVTSPHFPLPHPHGLNCTYRIQVGRKNNLSLRFLTFDLEGDNSVGFCSFDWLTISCILKGTSTASYSTLRKLCGQIRWSSELRYSNCTFVVLQFRSDLSVAKGGFKIQYSIANNSRNFTGIGCRRREFNESDGVIALPYDPNGYVSRIDCVYTAYSNASSIFAVDLKAFNWARLRQDMGNCIQFYCEGEKIWNFSSCLDFVGQMNKTLFFHRCQKLRLSVISEFFDYSQEYRIPFKVFPSDGLCGNTSFSKSNGAILLPNVSVPTSLEQNCTYSIAGGINTTISISISNVEPRFKYPYYSYSSFQKCRDRVTMTCLQSPNFNPYADKRFCTQLRWPSTIHFFNCSVLTVAYEFGDIANAMKFRLNYTVTRTENRRAPEYLPALGCDVYPSTRALTKEIKLPVQSVSSLPLVSLNCRHNADLMAIGKGLISVEFRQIVAVFQNAQDCSQDNVTISCVSDKPTANINSTKSLTFCGGGIPTALTVFSFTDCVYIQFTLRSRAYYPIEPRSMIYGISSDECGNTSFVSSSGYITSPRFPLSYPIASNCIYDIEAGDRKAVTLRSLTFQLQGRSYEPLIIPAPSSDNHYIKFGDDHRYTSYYNRYDRCSGDWLTLLCISNGSSIAQTNKGLFNQMLCGSKLFNTTIYGCQTLRLKFVSSSEVRATAGSGFNIRYDVKHIENSDATCSGDTHLNDSSGTVVYPEKLQFYPNGMNCNYVITAGRSRSVLLKFLYLSSQHGIHYHVGGTYDPCNQDWMQIRCSSRQSGLVDQLENRKFCGNQKAFTVLLDGCSHVNVSFVSNSAISSQGFQFQYEVVPAGEECGKREFVNATGVITSPAFPAPYPHRANCTYVIEVGSENSLSLQFSIFDVGHHHYSTFNRYSCTNDYVKISCVSRDPNDPVIANQYLDSQLCGFKNPFSTTLYKCNRYALEFVSTGTYSKQGFRILYTISTMDEKCGNRIFSNKTDIITSPGYPRSYAHQLDCTYNIEVGANKTLSLQFLAFNIWTISYRQACTTDWVKILCLSRDSDESVSTAQDFNTELCGRKSPFNVTLTGCNRAAIKLLVSRVILPESGFRLRYVISERSYCGYPSTTFTNTTGVIVSPNLAMEHMPTNISCTYFILAKQISAISLTIVALHRQKCDSRWLSIRCLKNDEVLDSSLKLCEKRISDQEVVFPSCSSVQLIYRSPNYETNFFILYTIKGTEDVCGDSLFTQPSGVISFPKFSSNYATDFNCSYSILAGSYSAILVNLSSLADAVEVNKTCSGDWIAIFCRDGNRNNTYRITHGECNRLEKRISISLTNCSTADIVFHSKNTDTGRFFQMSYELVHSTFATEKSALTTTLPSIATDLCPNVRPVHSNGTSCKCPDDQSGQTTTYTEEPAFTNTIKGALVSLDSGQNGSFVGSKSFGVLIACVVLLLLLLLFVASVVAVVVWRRNRKRNEDETTLICDDGGRENFNSRENSVFSPFSSQEEHQSGGANCYVHLEPMMSNLS